MYGCGCFFVFWTELLSNILSLCKYKKKQLLCNWHFSCFQVTLPFRQNRAQCTVLYTLFCVLCTCNKTVEMCGLLQHISRAAVLLCSAVLRPQDTVLCSCWSVLCRRMYVRLLPVQFCNACTANTLILHHGLSQKRDILFFTSQIIHFYPFQIDSLHRVCVKISFLFVLFWTELTICNWVGKSENWLQHFHILFLAQVSVSDITRPLTLEA